MSTFTRPDVWLACGLRTPFAKVDGALAGHDAIALSVPVVQAMLAQLGGAQPDFTVWGSVVPNLTWSNLAREILMEAGAPPTIPAFSTIMRGHAQRHQGHRQHLRRRRAGQRSVARSGVAP